MADESTPAVAVRLSGSPTGAGTFTVQSATDPEQSWAVEWVNAKTHWCGCPKFTNEQRCRHSLAVFDAIAREWQERRAAEAEARRANQQATRRAS